MRVFGDRTAVTAPGRPRRPAIVSRTLSVAVFGLAGLLFYISADTSHGENIRNDKQSLQLSDLIRAQGQRNSQDEADLARLRAEADRLAASQGGDPSAQARVDSLQGPSGLAPVSGPGLVVTLTDAPPDATARIPGIRPPAPDDLVVHQQDIQAVVNALWSGGATAVQIMDQRVIATSAVRCVGNTLILHGRVYSPPYVISAVGDRDTLRHTLDANQAVYNYTTYVQAYGLGWKVEDRDQLNLPGYSGPLDMGYAKAS